MEPQTGATLLLALAIMGHGVAWLFRTPKESAAEMTERVERIENKHHALDLRFAIAEARLSAELRHLSNTIERLIALMQGNGEDHARISGRHPTSLG
ncbi:MAG TPA: hypothetical protein VHQ21_13535 [Rhodanobacteraceae bacterium]|jgi:hypothetical protein|nr:hypothetical protein [Rhodanobacteraceae bacterium]